MYTALRTSDSSSASSRHSSEETKGFLETDSEAGSVQKGDRETYRSRLRRCVPWVFHGVLLLVSFTALAYAQHLLYASKALCYERYNADSPISTGMAHEDSVPVDYKYSLWYQSPFKGPPNDEVNEAWESIMRYGTISVTAEDVATSGVTPNASSVLFPESAGGGYLAVAGGTHQIHCLHWIWKDHHSNYFTEMKSKKKDIPEMYERHYEHCVDYLRQGIMCNFDTGIIPYNWVRDNQQPTPNGNTHHKCVNWDRLQDWFKDRAVDIPTDFIWSQPPGVVSLLENP